MSDIEIKTPLGWSIRLTDDRWRINKRDKNRRSNMAKVKAFYDNEGNTLTVWFGDAQKEHVCEEVSEGIVLMKDHLGKVIGFEKLNYASVPADRKISFETAVL